MRKPVFFLQNKEKKKRLNQFKSRLKEDENRSPTPAQKSQKIYLFLEELKIIPPHLFEFQLKIEFGFDDKRPKDAWWQNACLKILSWNSNKWGVDKLCRENKIEFGLVLDHE